MGKELVYRSISFSDFHKVGVSIGASLVEDELQVVKILDIDAGKILSKNDLIQMLWTLGISKEYNYEVMPKTFHRKMDGSVVEDYRIVGVERKDKNWLNSGYASEEARLSSSKMQDMGSYVRKLQRGGD